MIFQTIDLLVVLISNFAWFFVTLGGSEKYCYLAI